MIENVSTQLTVFHCFAHCLLPGRAFASLYALLFLEKEAEIGGRELAACKISSHWPHCVVSLSKTHLSLLCTRVGIKPGFYHKAQPNGFYDGGFGGGTGFMWVL